MTICMVCQTQIEPKNNGDKEVDVKNLTRNDIKCKIYYVAEIHPGGW